MNTRHFSAWGVGLVLGWTLTILAALGWAQAEPGGKSGIRGPDRAAQLRPLTRAHPAYLDLLALIYVYRDAAPNVEVIRPEEIYLRIGQARLRYDDGLVKNFPTQLDNPDLKDMMSQPYAPGPTVDPGPPDHDPGRIRVTPFFQAVYGASPADVQAGCVMVDFCGRKVLFNGRHGAARALARVGIRLTALLAARPDLTRFVFPLAGTYNWKVIDGTKRLGPHSWAVAIDLSVARGPYWRCTGLKIGPDLLKIRQGYPLEIVQAFEDNGFIWGGKWAHFDLMHFEYRPELLLKAKWTRGP